MPKVLDIVDVKKVIEDRFKQLYPSSPPKHVDISRASQYPSLGIWSVFFKISSNDKVRKYFVDIEIETGNIKSLKEEDI